MRACRSAGAGDYLPRVHARFNDFQRDFVNIGRGQGLATDGRLSGLGRSGQRLGFPDLPDRLE
jgi:hypothetical protein